MITAIILAIKTLLIIKAQNALSHSRSYVQVKIHRALFSWWEERGNAIRQEASDSKTSTLFAYMATGRNPRTLQTLANHPPLKPSRKKFLSLAKTSLEIVDLIKEGFFPEYNLDLREIGYESYDEIFSKYLT